MPRTARQESESGFYHVIMRGIGKQILFEEPADYHRFLGTLQRYRREMGFELTAYCLMENHVHLLIEDRKRQLSLIMKRIAGSYAYYYNQKYERTGHLFQDRFRSVVIEDDAALLSVIRYIHRNPEKAGIAKAQEYEWSSFSSYLGPAPGVDNRLALELFEGREGFAAFMAKEAEGDSYLEPEGKPRIGDRAAKEIIREELGQESGTWLQQCSKEKRDESLRRLKARGLSIRQLERLTGVNRGVIQLA